MSDFYATADRPPENGAGVQSLTLSVAKNTNPTSTGCVIAESAISCSNLSDSVCFDVGDHIALQNVNEPGDAGIDTRRFVWTAVFAPISGACP